MPAFTATRIGEAAFPELVYVAGVVAVDLATVALDAAAGRVTALTKWNTWGHFLMMGGAIYGLGAGWNPSICKTVMIADAVPLTSRVMAPLIHQALGVSRKSPARSSGSQQVQEAQRLLADARRRSSGGVGYNWKETRAVPFLV